MNIKHVAVSAAIALSTLALGAGAMAQNNANPMNLAISGSGQVALSGNVTAISGNTVSVNSWLGTWAVNAASATISPTPSTVADIKVGDTIAVSGTLGTGMAINATHIADVSLKAAIKKNSDDNGKHKGWLNLNGFFRNWFKKN